MSQMLGMTDTMTMRLAEPNGTRSPIGNQTFVWPVDTRNAKTGIVIGLPNVAADGRGLGGTTWH